MRSLAAIAGRSAHDDAAGRCKRLVVALTLCTVVASPAIALAAAGIEILPAVPTSANVLHVTVNSGVRCHPTSAVLSDGVDVQSNGAQIKVLLSASNCPVSPPFDEYVFSFDIGPLAAGSYEIEYSARTMRSTDEIGTYGSTQAPITLGVEVIGAAVALPDPIATPTLSTQSLVALIVVLGAVCAGAWRRRRRS